MKFGVYNAILHDRTLTEALKAVKALGLEGIELNTGGFLPPVHIPNHKEIMESDTARDEYLGIFEEHGLELLGLNCNGNPLHPNPKIRGPQSQDVLNSIKLARRLNQNRVVTMSGCPGDNDHATYLNWIVNGWSSAALDVLDYQFGVAAKFWKEANALAADLDVKVALELHPQNLVFNVPSTYRFIEEVKATHVGVELDASHLYWQQMDPAAVVRELGGLVYHAAAKDVRINSENAKLVGVLDNSFVRTTENRTNLGDQEFVNAWPKDSAWDFVAVGKGHDSNHWAEFLTALNDVDPNMIVNIEHEDTSMGRIEGLEFATKVLYEGADKAGIKHN
jgi:sugar phosphate isomerase/epimerase